MAMTVSDPAHKIPGRVWPTWLTMDVSAIALSLVALLVLARAAGAVSSAPTPEGGPQSPAPGTSPQSDISSASTAPNTPPTPEDFAIHAQSTFTFQYHPAFRSAYRGAQSLDPGSRGDETFDLTLYGGFRPWRGGEIWINPETEQGFGLSNTFGVAGYVSGEAYKLGHDTPYYRLPRAFFRQTVNLGGEIQGIAPDLNQLGGTQTADRLVFTVGKFSVVDIFDTNKFAHDPRNDFLNWSVIDLGSFDYAAEAWGFTYGLAAEWYQNWWTIRAGLFDQSAKPNDKYLDNRFLSQTQFNLELEERHTLWDQPGKLKFLYWLTRARVGRYSDATALAVATGTTPSTGMVRDYRGKAGFGLNLEQQLTEDLGLFARVGWSDGTVEEVDFTEINQTASVGLSLAGTQWERPDDTVGIAGVVNQISHAGKNYLRAGGLGGIIGDGQLLHAGPEQIIETYYSFAIVKGFNASADYQFINDPAYNRDRGPVSVLGVRLHAQF